MDISARLSEDLKAALRSNDEVQKRTIRMLLASLKNQQIENRAPLDGQQELSLLQREAKRRRETAEEYGRLGRQDMAEREMQELEVIQSYLPAALSTAELQSLVREAIAETGAASPREMGKVMAALRPRVSGRADGKVLSDLVREALTSGAAS